MADQVAWRIAARTPAYREDDVSGTASAKNPGRWNERDVPMLYTATTIALSCLETLVHLEGDRGLPLNRFLMKISIPSKIWSKRDRFDPSANPGWDALPEGLVARHWGSQWAAFASSAILEVPSVVVPEEACVLINPRHPDAKKLDYAIVRAWTYDLRLRK